jgi:hypothetical protein
MNLIQITAASAFILLMGFAWYHYFRRDIHKWFAERGPRRQLALEAALERQREMDRLRDELAAKYLEPSAAKPPEPRS